MGFFDLLFGNKSAASSKVRDDKVWLSAEARLRGIQRQLAESRYSAAVLLIGHFRDTVAALQTVAQQHKGTVPTTVAEAENLSTAAAERLAISSDATVDLIVAERHPLYSSDEAIVKFAEQLPCRATVSFHLALQDPVLHHVAGDWLEAMLHKLGLHELVASTEDEYVDIACRLIDDGGYRQSLVDQIEGMDLDATIFADDSSKQFTQAMQYLVKHHARLQAEGDRTPLVFE